MTAVQVRTPRVSRYELAASPAFTPHARPLRIGGDRDERNWTQCSFVEGYKTSPEMRRKTWADYKALHVPALRAVLERPDVRMLAVEAHVPGHGIGWLAWTPWPSVDIVHWAYVGRPFRRRGALKALIAAAGLRRNVVYTHRAGMQAGVRDFDHVLARWMASAGHDVSHVPYNEWSK